VNRTTTPLTRDQCVVRLSSHCVGRVSVSIDALPVIVPVVYLLDGDSVLFRAPLDSALADACADAVIAFEADDFDASVVTNASWSVHIVGVGSLLDEREQLRVLSLGSQDVTGRDMDQIVRLSLGHVRGNELHATPLASAG
jgi:uncharacterized protein